MAKLIGIIVIVAVMAGIGNMALQAGQDIAATHNAKIEATLNGF